MSSSRASSYIVDLSVYTRPDSGVPSMRTMKRRRREGHLFLPPPSPSSEYSNSEPSAPPSPSTTVPPTTAPPPTISKAEIARATPPPRLLQVNITHSEVASAAPLPARRPLKIHPVSSTRNRNVVKLARILGEHVPVEHTVHSPTAGAFPRSPVIRKRTARHRPPQNLRVINELGYLATGLVIDPHTQPPRARLIKSYSPTSPTVPEERPANLEVRVEVEVETFVDDLPNHTPIPVVPPRNVLPEGLDPSSVKPARTLPTPPGFFDAHSQRPRAWTQASHIRSRSDFRVPAKTRARSQDLDMVTLQHRVGHTANVSFGHLERSSGPVPTLEDRLRQCGF